LTPPPLRAAPSPTARYSAYCWRSMPAPPSAGRSSAGSSHPSRRRRTSGSSRSRRRWPSARSGARGGAWAIPSGHWYPPTRPRLGAPPTGRTSSPSWWASYSTTGSAIRSAAWRSYASPRAHPTRRSCVRPHVAVSGCSRPRSRRSCGAPWSASSPGDGATRRRGRARRRRLAPPDRRQDQHRQQPVPHGRAGWAGPRGASDRTATVVFFIGDRLYGTITAFVSGTAADRYDFSSALPL